MSYHKRPIKKGVYGEFSKILEEVDEAEEAQEQCNKILELVELSDIYGALEEYVQRRFSMSMEDLKNMSDRTKASFNSGQRG